MSEISIPFLLCLLWLVAADEHPGHCTPTRPSVDDNLLLIIMYMAFAPWIHIVITWTVDIFVKTLMPTHLVTTIQDAATSITTGLYSSRLYNIITSVVEYRACVLCEFRATISSCLRYVYDEIASLWMTLACPSHLVIDHGFVYVCRLAQYVDDSLVHRLTIRSIQMNIVYGPYSAWRTARRCLKATVHQKCLYTDLCYHLSFDYGSDCHGQFDFPPGARTAILSVNHSRTAWHPDSLALDEAGFTINVAIHVYGLDDYIIRGYIRLAYNLQLQSSTFSYTTIHSPSLGPVLQTLGYYSPNAQDQATSLDPRDVEEAEEALSLLEIDMATD
jgi:hypothetical protein